MPGDPRYRYYLTVTLSGIEEDPCKGYVGLDVEVASDGFCGASGCDLPIADLKLFAGDLVALADSRSTGASLVGGCWGTVTTVELRFSPTGSRGHIQISVVLTEEDEQSASVSCTFSSEPQALHRFADALVRALSSKGTARLPLYVEGGPAV